MENYDGMPKVAIITACDERFLPLAKGLLLSLRDHGFPNDHDHVHVLDIGCTESTLDWMRSLGIQTATFCSDEHLPFQTSHLPAYAAAMACRPFLRNIFPDYDIYLWIDSDTWVQDGSSLRLYKKIAASNPERIVLTPMLDYSYKMNYSLDLQIQYLRPIYEAIYGEDGRKLSLKAILSAGVFAMHRQCPFWEAWARELPKVYSREYSSDQWEALHLAEQTALNFVVYSGAPTVFLEALHNYHICSGVAFWDAGKQGDQLLVACPPYRKIGIVHLCDFPRKAEWYVEHMPFYKRGKYLTAREIDSLRQLKRTD